MEVIRQDQHLTTYTPQHDTIRLATWKCGMENGLGCLHATQRKQFSHAQQLHWSQFASAPYEKPAVYVVGQTVKDWCWLLQVPKCSKSIQISSLNMHSIQSISSATCQLLVNACISPGWFSAFQDESNHLDLPDGLQTGDRRPVCPALSLQLGRHCDFRRSRLVSWSTVWKWKTIYSQKSRIKHHETALEDNYDS